MRAIRIIFILCLMTGRLPALHPGGPFLLVKNPHNSGMFAVFSSVLGALDMVEHGAFSGMRVKLDGWYLDPAIGPNWWDYYFEPIQVGHRQPYQPVYSFSFKETSTVIHRGLLLGRERAHELIKRYIKVKPEIEDACDEFINLNFKGYYVIGVHHRGTDKWKECPPVPYEVTRNAVENIINENKSRYPVRIFVATDEAKFLEFMQTSFPDQVISCDFSRSTTKKPLHVSDHLYSGNYQKGKEALLDCLLLSRCQILVRPPRSCLSVTASRFDINLRQIIVRANEHDTSKDFY